MSVLSQFACSACRKEEPPITEEEIQELHPLVPSWKIVREEGVRKLLNRLSFDTEEQAKAFVERVMEHARKQNHHPVIDSGGADVSVAWWTHSIHDLHPNDFIMAAKTDGAYEHIIVGAEGDMSADTPPPKLEEAPRFKRLIKKRNPTPPINPGQDPAAP
ncbi:MAG: 4a-hydroxytetrahydrobiopterin dehydratase [Opitutales bacterium]